MSSLLNAMNIVKELLLVGDNVVIINNIYYLYTIDH